MNKLTIGYFADGPWSHRALDVLLSDDSLEIGFICARNNNPDEHLRKIAADQNIDFLLHQNVNSEEFIELVQAYECDLFVSMSFNQIFRQPLISLPRLQTINCHAGMLPFYRGCSVLNWVLINDEPEFGITVHFMDEGIDTGDIILQRGFPITEDDNYGTLLQKAYENCSKMLHEAIKLLQSGDFERIEQDSIDPIGFYCTARGEKDEILNWNQSSRDVFNFVRALYDPGPIARSEIGGKEIKIRKVEMIPGMRAHKGFPGAVVGKNRDSFLVKTSDTAIRVVDWECETTPKIGDRLG